MEECNLVCVSWCALRSARQHGMRRGARAREMRRGVCRGVRALEIRRGVRAHEMRRGVRRGVRAHEPHCKE